MNTITYGHKVAGVGIEPIPPYNRYICLYTTRVTADSVVRQSQVCTNALVGGGENLFQVLSTTGTYIHIYTH